MLRWLARVFAALTAAAVLGGLALGWAVWQFRAPGPLEEETIVLIERGTGLRTIATRLEEAGIVADDRLFLLGVYLNRAERSLRAGEYAFPPAASGRQAMAILRSGESVSYTLTVPEGLTSREILASLEEEERLTGEVPDPPPAEGTLLPETYAFHRNDTRAAMIERMRAEMDETVAALWAERAEDLPIETPEEAVILASIIEKETGVDGERRMVASVFHNRLDRGMPLQSDPTVIYALTEGEGPLDRALTRQDWQVESAYNTYRIPGLPPGPIANPGREAIAAAVNPDETDYLYFVADGTGGHAFARTLDEHNRNVAEWRRIRDGAGD
ncbi:MAG: endolytic transglycosylase MltG [Azospirillaceae bacterium]